MEAATSTVSSICVRVSSAATVSGVTVAASTEGSTVSGMLLSVAPTAGAPSDEP
ncbi:MULTISPECIES: hypothetical protein [unclassified Streptomyces]|uniref:hypothetical protein n=1 Tax=unclassified Streptomyces TaxID=2593676 RepID=UPI001368D007|nr:MULTISPECIES: hypothetical protein [unclassified Streptomyces]MYS24700.1 hypothetical protein [Streptomyces sp. SID4948]